VASSQKPVARLLATVTAALEGGISAVQLRDKGAYTPQEQVAAGRGLRQLSHAFDVPFLVNDDPELARRLDADGVHVGRDDPSPRIARAMLGPKAIIGVTVYGKAGEETAAAENGADYLASGPFFPSPTKPAEPLLPLHILDTIVGRSTLPVFAIGGVNAENAGLLASHRVAGVAVVSAIMDAPDPRRATEAIRRAFSEGSRA
jgi:thiamine-phosphate pyrophosphorylase